MARYADQEAAVKVENNNSRVEIFNQLEAEFGRPLSSMELQIVNDWLDKDNYSAIMIKLALRQAVMNSVKSSNIWIGFYKAGIVRA